VIHILWMIESKADRLSDFEDAYGMNGRWVQLFRKAEGYVETALMRDTANAKRFLVVDRWRDLESFEAFKRQHRTEYDDLDRSCEELTLNEKEIGIFNS
jgi:heme-degrading monooxygenase HmoA